MRSIRILAVVLGTLALASGCSGGSDLTPADNIPPVANFSQPSCTVNVTCDFSSTSTDDAEVTTWIWDFNGDGNWDATTASASYTYSTAATFNISLMVRDAQGLSNTKTSTITVAPAPNGAPVAEFAVPQCAATVACGFASSSSDDVAVTEWSWDLNGDGTPDATTETASFTYTTAGTFNVSLTVRDAGGLSNSVTSPITVAAAPVNPPPTAAFTHSCPGAVCKFTSTSTDVAPGSIASHAWTFGDGFTGDEQNPQHSYAITLPKEFTVTLTVTDNQGATDIETQTFTISPPPNVAEGCTTSDANVDCALDVPARSTMKVKLVGISCDLAKERIVTPAPISDQVFLGVCRRTVGEEIGIFGGFLDNLIVYEAGSQVRIRIVQGTPDQDHPVLNPPAAQVVGTFPDWNISFEDGADPGIAGEPDFADVVFTVHATLVP
jgi:PKD repeat protein